MTRIEKCELAINKGCIYDAKTGKIHGVTGKEIKSIGSQGYINMILCANSKRYNLRANHFAYYCIYNECDGEIDHINGIKHDNRICNLRKVSTQENAFNRLKAKGYHWDGKKYVAQIKINGKSKHLGRFDSEEEAREVYLNEKNKIHIIKPSHNESDSNNLG